MREEISNRLASLSIRDLMLVAAVDRCGGFRSAAEEMGISASGLSHQVRKVEAVLGVTIFERGSRNVTPTDAGIVMLGRIGALLQHIEEIGREADRRSGAFGGRLRIGVISTVGPFLIPRVVSFLRDRHPYLELALMEGKHEGLSRRLKDGEIDLVITACPMADEAFNQLELLKESFHLLTRADDPIVAFEQIEQEQLLTLNLLPLSEDDFPMDKSGRASKGTHGSDTSIFRSYGLSIETRVRLVLAHGYVCLVPSLTSGELTSGGKLALVPIKHMPIGRKIFALWRRSSPYSIDFETLTIEISSLMRQREDQIPGETGYA
ncbi:MULTISPECIES: LysR family transcriptional regulator [unclassified Rhizobium]|uniref:LysR family transcriptional regulator n=1 Tax=unclassified Rhizobium TaxID=2613769 RepID=UPI001A98F7D9|nr:MULTISPECIES: LysR family transcriptional regulator [unclassified Rhizobium]MBT9372563.1 LysR family transcriptional regulator [Rhizobium sp. CSW-27]QSZ60550.1 LysR family transcriptional regulator [Rhizobium sp. ZX09]